METQKKFPNGFTSWMETHHEIVRYITLELDSYENDGVIVKTMETKGIGGEYELAERWTDEFEQMNEGNDYSEDDFFDKVQKFCKLKDNERTI